MNQSKKRNPELSYSVFLVAALVVLSGLVMPLSMIKWFDHDELEHIHSAWYLANGYLPYTDFFQNHNPLLWYLLVPFIRVFGETSSSIIAARLLTFVFMAGNLILTYLISRKTGVSRQASLLAVLFLLSSSFFVVTDLEVRPDVPQVFFGLLSIYFLACFARIPSIRDIIFSGIALSVSFLFLQKAVFLSAVLGLFLLYYFFRGKIRFLHIFCFGAAFLLPLGLFCLYLHLNGLVEDYLLTNWVLNMNRLKEFSPLVTVRRFFRGNFLFFTLSAASLPYLLVPRKEFAQARKIALVAFCLGLFLFLPGRPHKQNFLQFLPLLAITSSVMVHSLFERVGAKRLLKIFTVFTILGISSISVFRTYRITNHYQLETISYVVENSDQGDMIYDGDIQFNLFRPDLHYFWYSLKKKKLFDSYNLVTDGRFADYDVYELIRSLDPRFISDFHLDRKNPGFSVVGERYSKTPYAHIYLRKPERGTDNGE